MFVIKNYNIYYVLVFVVNLLMCYESLCFHIQYLFFYIDVSIIKINNWRRPEPMWNEWARLNYCWIRMKSIKLKYGAINSVTVVLTDLGSVFSVVKCWKKRSPVKTHVTLQSSENHCCRTLKLLFSLSFSS